MHTMHVTRSRQWLPQPDTCKDCTPCLLQQGIAFRALGAAEGRVHAALNIPFGVQASSMATILASTYIGSPAVVASLFHKEFEVVHSADLSSDLAVHQLSTWGAGRSERRTPPPAEMPSLRAQSMDVVDGLRALQTRLRTVPAAAGNFLRAGGISALLSLMASSRGQADTQLAAASLLTALVRKQPAAAASAFRWRPAQLGTFENLKPPCCALTHPCCARPPLCAQLTAVMCLPSARWSIGE